MRKLFIMTLAAIGIATLAGTAMAADATAATTSAKLDSFGLGLVGLATAIGMAIAAAGCGIGQGMGLKGACEGVARNPEASNKLTTMLLLGLAFIESLAIYALVINLILLLMNPFV